MKRKVFLFAAKVSKKNVFIALLVLCTTGLFAQNGSITGKVLDAQNGETLIGAAVTISGTTTGGATDFDGNYTISNLKPGTYTLTISYISYKSQTKADVKVEADKATVVDIRLETADISLKEVQVVSQVRKVNEVAMITAQKASLVVQNGVSSQQIKRTQDKDASEVIKRVPGITINQNKFVIVRGLSDRYNNVWVNGAAVPSSEADKRAFSFDIIPSSQLDNIMIIKSPAPEYPADFTGGFILVNTKDIPPINGFSIGINGVYNTNSHFKDSYYNPGSPTDFLGFDNGMRALKNGFPTILDNNNSSDITQFTRNGFNNNWNVNKIKPYGDLSLNASFTRNFKTEDNKQWGILGAVNYSNKYTTFRNMLNNQFSIYNRIEDKSEYVRKYIDNQYTNTARLGALLNITFIPNKNDKYELKNIFNQIGENRYTNRTGIWDESGLYEIEESEYYYNSRATYSGQLKSTYTREKHKMDWSIGYAYANNNRPDRRLIFRQKNDDQNDPRFGEYKLDQNEIKREFGKLDEHIFTATANYEKNLSLFSINPTLKTGFYGEYRMRNYQNRRFYYRMMEQNLPQNFAYLDPVTQVLQNQNYSADKLYIYEDVDRRNSYKASNMLLAGYLGLNIPLNQKINIYTGVRYEFNRMLLNTYTDLAGELTKDIPYYDSNFFPSLNATYKINTKQQLRLAYGTSINRQQFREIAPFVYYDFDIFSLVNGNKNLKPATIQNIDFRYEIYPSIDEMISLAVFDKYFVNPIEWSYTVSGAGKNYKYENVPSANNYGIELEVKKNLDFIGMNDFSLVFNGSLIKSKVTFDANSLEIDRPMQGQSNYIVNTGLFYNNQPLKLNVSLLYNRIGQRIVEVGRTDKSAASSINNMLPDTYEMPRDVIDFTFGKNFGEHWELKAGIQDLLADKVQFIQYPKFIDNNGNTQTREQITKEYTPGRNIMIGVTYNF
ncbi:MAG: TonB-dependent receptor [Paludibacteraceae bacterium]